MRPQQSLCPINGKMKDSGDACARAERLGNRLDRSSMNSTTDRFLRGRPYDEIWSVACSGGSDSVALLLLVFAWFPAYRKGLRICHFNHGFRGAESDADEAFVRDLATKLGLEITCDRWEGAPLTRITEASLREARLQFYFSALKGTGGALLLVGHHAGDVAETVLMRLARGSGAGGLCAPRPVQSFAGGAVFVRPLLDLPKRRITEALESCGIEWREDGSNQSPRFLRNRVRHRVLPVMKANAGREVEVGIVRSRRLLEEDDCALQQWMGDLVGESELDRSISDLGALKSKPVALLRRALNQWLNRRGLNRTLSAKSVDTLLEEIVRGNRVRFSAGNDQFIESDSYRLRLVSAKSEVSWKPFRLLSGSRCFLPDGSVLGFETVGLSPELRRAVRAGERDEKEEVFLGVESPSETPFLVVRRWIPGDRYVPLGAPGSRKLQDLFVDRKVPRGERSRRPVVCSESGDILWCPGLPPAQTAKVDPSSSCALRLTYRATHTE